MLFSWTCWNAIAEKPNGIKETVFRFCVGFKEIIHERDFFFQDLDWSESHE